MRKLFFLVLLAVLFLGLGLLLSCGDDDDDDDDSGGDDDDSSSDDDAADDDATDDDASGDDDSASGDTWTDPSSGLTWQNPPSSYMQWDEAKTYCENLSFDGHDDWRLPTISELRSLIRGCDATELGGSCGVTDSCLDSTTCLNDPCWGCDYLEGPGDGGAYWPEGMTGEISWHWSSSPVADVDYGAWAVKFGCGRVDNRSTDYYYELPYFARCVRP